MNTGPETHCPFCRIVSGEAPAHRIWENTSHVAFLSIFPNTEDFSVAIPKAHRPSYVVETEPSEYTALRLAPRKVAHRLDKTFDDVARTGIMYQGYLSSQDHTRADDAWLSDVAQRIGESAP